MDSDKKGTTAPRPAKPTRLKRALNKSEHVKNKVEECAQELSSVNAVLKEEITEHLPLEEVEQALLQSEKIENKVQECAEDLHSVNEALAQEITERQKLERELSDTQAELSDSQAKEEDARHLASHDSVTGLPNRALFNERLEHALAQAERHVRSLAVMFIDLDQFKNINDSYGHGVGDKVLQMVATRLQASVRTGDTISRQGGDEFLYLLPEVKDESYVVNIAQKIIDTISDTCEIDGIKFTVQPSIGIALYPNDGKTAEALLANADAAMYRAKQNNTGYFFFNQLAAV